MDQSSLSPEALALLFDEPVYRFGNQQAGTCKGKNLAQFLMVFDKLPDETGAEAGTMFRNFLKFGGYQLDDIGLMRYLPGSTLKEWKKATSFNKLLIWSDTLVLSRYFEPEEREGVHLLQAYSLDKMTADRDAKIALSKAFEQFRKGV